MATVDGPSRSAAAAALRLGQQLFGEGSRWTAVNAWSGQWLAVLVGVVTVVALARGYGRAP